MATKRTLTGGVLLGMAAALVAFKTCAAEKPKHEPRTPPQLLINTNPLPKDTRGITSFAPVVKSVAQSVVTISTTTSRRMSPNSPFNDPFFRRFFGIPDGEDGEEPTPSPRGRRGPPMPQERGIGSGVIISKDGYILSNNHVVEGADEVKVQLPNSEAEFTAKVIGSDPKTDLAVLKIDGKDLQPVTITDSDQLQVGDVVLAVGNPFGVGQTVTMGIVSATGRGGFGIVDYEDFIQTDASINPGNSGGALVDAEGRLVGINTAIISRTGGNMGIGFAVPINMVRGVMQSIIQYGKVTRGYLGVLIGDVTPTLAQKLNIKSTAGAFVSEVPPNSPAAAAGLRDYDVITEFNGRKVPDSRQLRLWVSQTPPKTKVNLKLLRDGKEQTAAVTLGELPTDQAIAGMRGGGDRGQQQSDTEALKGVEVSDIDQRTRRQFNIPANIRGAVITNIDPESKAAEAGLQPGDVITEIERRKVNNAEEAIAASEKLKAEEPVLLRIYSARAGTSRIVVVDAEKPAAKEQE